MSTGNLRWKFDFARKSHFTAKSNHVPPVHLNALGTLPGHWLRLWNCFAKTEASEGCPTYPEVLVLQGYCKTSQNRHAFLPMNQPVLPPIAWLSWKTPQNQKQKTRHMLSGKAQMYVEDLHQAEASRRMKRPAPCKLHLGLQPPLRKAPFSQNHRLAQNAEHRPWKQTKPLLYTKRSVQCLRASALCCQHIEPCKEKSNQFLGGWLCRPRQGSQLTSQSRFACL